MEYDILQKLVLNSYLFWKKKTKQSHIMRPTKVNSWIKELNGKNKTFYFTFLQYRKIRESPQVLMLEKSFLYMKEITREKY